MQDKNNFNKVGNGTTEEVLKFICYTIEYIQLEYQIQSKPALWTYTYADMSLLRPVFFVPGKRKSLHVL